MNRKHGVSPNIVKKVFPWATFKDFLLGRQCKAALEKTDGMPYWGRCELLQDHICDHAIERGFDTPQWKTTIVSN